MKISLIIISILALTGCNTLPENQLTDLSDNYDQAPEADLSSYEVLACYDLFDHDKEKIIVGLAVNYDVTYDDFEGGGVIISSAEVMKPALHTITGLNRVWAFDCSHDHCSHQIHLEPNGKAFYYDFSDADEAKASLSLECEYDADYEKWVNEGFAPDPVSDEVEVKNTSGTKI